MANFFLLYANCHFAFSSSSTRALKNDDWRPQRLDWDFEAGSIDQEEAVSSFPFGTNATRGKHFCQSVWACVPIFELRRVKRVADLFEFRLYFDRWQKRRFVSSGTSQSEALKKSSYMIDSDFDFPSRKSWRRRCDCFDEWAPMVPITGPETNYRRSIHHEQASEIRKNDDCRPDRSL